MYLLDTNVVSELRKTQSSKANKQVLSWAKATPHSNLFLSSITVLELEIGILLVERKDIAQGRLLRTWLEDHVLPAFADRILSIDTVVARKCARLNVPNQRSDRDSLIAATAIVHGMTIVTRNVKDFDFDELKVINPWC
ncbi:MAG: type II toxin-antitoxin system VapC family toxin [Candidatus Melainabacteria bacterium]|nr:type II toxin-antitoxin system VapC family toxin [Candidatus Melainabacteria bacterium]